MEGYQPADEPVYKYNLLIVESPVKAKTISQYLREDKEDEWIVKHTGGHIYDLPKKRYGLNYEDDEVKGEWVIISKEAQKTMDELKNLAKNSEAVYIATDDDREGERIAADVARYLGVDFYERITFREITKKSILQELYSSIRELDNGVIEAAKANRFIDREIGYPLSTALRETFDTSLSEDPPRGVGRVISPALALICERERQIEVFEPERYNQVAIDYVYNGRSFRVHNQQKFKLEDEIHLNRYVSMLETSRHIVTKFDERIEDIAGHKPLHTPALQYSAWYVLQIMPEDSMKLAQRLFELGLITYHRTDAIRLSTQAVKQIRASVESIFGSEYLSASPKTYKTKKKEGEEDNIQDAHEAIRPSQFSVDYYPKNILKKMKLSEDELKLYKMIWARTLITQMADAKYDRSVIEVTVGEEDFNCRANERVFDGWEIVSDKVLNITNIKKDDNWQDKRVVLPRIKIDEELYPLEILPTEHSTRRPRRYGIGTFIDTVYNMGFSRPSTIGTLVKNLSDKLYIKLTKGIIYPTPLGLGVDDWTTQNFSWLNDVKHAKEFEEQLKKIENGTMEFGDELVIEYHRLVEEGAEKLGIDLSKLNSSIPTKAQIKLIHSIAEKKGIVVGDEVLKDREKADLFLKKHAKINKVKKCVYCADGEVREHEEYFKCSNNDKCNFIITKKRIRDFFLRFQKEIDEFELVEAVKGMMLKKGYRTEGLISKENKPFNTDLVFSHSNQYGWSVSFKPRKGSK